MSRPIRFVLLAAAVALVGTACASSNVAATVSGVDIMDDQVLALSVQDENAGTVNASDPCQDPDRVGPEQVCVGFRDDLTVLVFLEAMIRAAEDDFGITGVGTEEARAAYVATAPPEAEQLLRTLLDRPGRSTQAFADLIIDQLDIRARVQSALNHDEENLASLWEQRPVPEIDYCVHHILVVTEEEALAVQARLDAGESFSAVATEVSLDTGSPGGALPCPSDPARWVPPFAVAVAELEIGDVSDPVQTEFGWHVIAVSPRVPTSFEELVSDPDRWVPPQATNIWWSDWLDEALSAADIEVRSQIGTWFDAADGIAPPPASP
jgi:parvulin-like peptidyl-prolyl isomerase